MKSIFWVLLGLLIAGSRAQNSCTQKWIGDQSDPQMSFVCVCNSGSCDEVPSLPLLDNNTVAVYTTSRDSKRFVLTTSNFASNSGTSNMTVTIDSSQTFQSILGFGGAFTDAAGYNVMNLAENSRINWLKSYFGPNGIGYTVGRVPMGSCDFSVAQYTYDDAKPHGSDDASYKDFALKNFSLNPEDYAYKIPLIQAARSYVGDNLKLFASPWTPPEWMKTSHNLTGVPGSTIIGDLYKNTVYWQTWAQYFVKFFESFTAENIKFWGLTIQNEPLENATYQALFMPNYEERDFLKLFLGPAIRAHPVTKHLKIMLFDYSRKHLEDYVTTILSDEAATSYADGIAMHWYEDAKVDASVLDRMNSKFPDKWIMYTEACQGFEEENGLRTPVVLGSWKRAQQYAHDIIENLNHWSRGWTDWNLALDKQGGPNWDANYVDSPTIIEDDNMTFYKQPMFYALGHFSKFILPDSVRVSLTIDAGNSTLEGVAFQNPMNQTVLVLHNQNSASYQVAIKDACNPNQVANVMVDPMSISTIVWKNQCSQKSPLPNPNPTGPAGSGTKVVLSYFMMMLGLLNFI